MYFINIYPYNFLASWGPMNLFLHYLTKYWHSLPSFSPHWLARRLDGVAFSIPCCYLGTMSLGRLSLSTEPATATHKHIIIAKQYFDIFQISWPLGHFMNTTVWLDRIWPNETSSFLNGKPPWETSPRWFIFVTTNIWDILF